MCPDPISASFSFLLGNPSAVHLEACGLWPFCLLLILALTMGCFVRPFSSRGFCGTSGVDFNLLFWFSFSVFLVCLPPLFIGMPC